MRYLFVFMMLFSFEASAVENIATSDGILVTEAGVEGDFTQFAQVVVQDNRLFNNRLSAQRFCQGFRRNNLANFCVVRGYDNNLFGANYRLVVRGQGQTRLGILNAILNFLNGVNLILNQVQLVVDFFNNDDL